MCWGFNWIISVCDISIHRIYNNMLKIVKFVVFLCGTRGAICTFLTIFGVKQNPQDSILRLAQKNPVSIQINREDFIANRPWTLMRGILFPNAMRVTPPTAARAELLINNTCVWMGTCVFDYLLYRFQIWTMSISIHVKINWTAHNFHMHFVLLWFRHMRQSYINLIKKYIYTRICRHNELYFGVHTPTHTLRHTITHFT